MTTQLLPNLIYAVLLITALLIPYATFFTRQDDDQSGRLLMLAITAGAVVLTALRSGFMPLGLILLVPLIGLGARPMLGGAAAILLFSTVTWWWTPETQMAPILVGAFVALGLVAALLPRLGRTPEISGEHLLPLLLPMFACLIAGLAAGLLSAPFGTADTIYMAWHHWGAYISPVEAWLAGGLPYRDFPIQYGLGPTALLAASCGNDCWRSMSGVVIVANALYFSTLAGCALILTTKLSLGLRALALVALFCATFIWAGFPPLLAGPAMTPSVAGLRFLPISALLLHILLAERRQQKRDAIGHVVWMIDVLWSPEAAFFGTVIWWPYLALRDAGRAAGPREAFMTLLRGAGRGAGALALGLAGLALVVALLSGGAARLEDFLAYVLHPPGPLPTNPSGTIWLGLTTIFIAMLVLARTASRSLYVCLLGFLAAASYYLSRSHDNNVLNMLPLLILVLLAILSLERARAADFVHGFIHTLLAAIVAFTATANFGPWSDAAAAGDGFALGPARLIDRFAAKPGDQPQILPSGAMAALQYARDRGGESVVIIDGSSVILRTQQAGMGWTSVNNIANYEPLPPAVVARYIHQGALTYCRSGWLVVDQVNYGSWMPLFDADYRVTEQHRFADGYAAYHLSPRLACTAR